MSKNVVIIDYHLGNLFSVQQACRHLGADAKISSDKNELLAADYAILPGVGAFGDAMKTLEELDLINPIHDFIQSGKPFMGVCLGLQLLFSESEEFGNHKGLNIVEGLTRRFPAVNTDGQLLKVPQIEWNQIQHANGTTWENSPLQECSEGEYMYFVHSYYVLPENKEVTLSTTTYGGLTYCSSIAKDNVFACQFHPERSGEHGLKIYRSFLNL
ncbi:MAG TPA: imidazole glycerol phosphate synthase subunit HisH [Chitinophagaceae bacterium]